MFKKLFFIVCIVCSLLVIAGCQSDQIPDVDPKDVRLNTLSTNGFIIRQGNDSVFNASVVLKNTGKVPVLIKNIKLDIKSGNGAHLGSVPTIPTPVILQPGETSIAGGTASSKQILSDSDFGKVSVKVDYEPTSRERSEWKISHVQGRQTPYGYIVTGKVTNMMKQKSESVLITVGLFNENNYILAALTTLVSGPINPGATVNFQTTDYIHIPQHILDKVHHIEAKAIGFKTE